MSGLSPAIELADIATGRGGFVIHGEAPGDRSGNSVAAAGDVNGDGFDDVIIGAYGARGFSGTAYVVFGHAGRFGPTVNLSEIARGEGGFALRGVSGSVLGNDVAGAHDVNGDGVADLVIGERLANALPRITNGATYVVFGSTDSFGAGFNLDPSGAGGGTLVIRGAKSGDQSGFSVDGAGDVNGDGFDDLIIGAYQADGPGNTRSLAGAAYVVFGRPVGGGAVIDLAAVEQGLGGFAIGGEANNDFAGRRVAGAGDVNGDGFDDLIIGARESDAPGRTDAGAAYVVFGKAAGFASQVDLRDVAQGQGGFVVRGTAASEFLSEDVAPAGDVNGDGIDDLIISDRAGAAYVVFGRADGFGAAVDLAQIALGQGGFVIGTGVDGGVHTAGDINGDGFDDLIVGAYRATAPGGLARAGAAYVVFGRGDGFGASVSLADVAAGRGGFVIRGEDAGDGAGFSVASAGDLNGDGFDDLIVGAKYADGAGNTSASAGDSYVIFGRSFTTGQDGTAAADRLRGGSGVQSIDGLAGNDTLYGEGGDDTLSGGEGRDRLIGGAGADVLSGGDGADRFVYVLNVFTGTDRILDFDRAEGDRIVLRGVDAVVLTADDDAFAFIGTVAFSGTAGELRAESIADGTIQRVQGDIDGDSVADVVIDVVRGVVAAADWFVL